MDRDFPISKEPHDTRVAVIGAGPVGSLIAGIIGKRGYIVDVYDFRKDIRRKDLGEIPKGRTINLALSTRGLAGLRKLGLDEIIVKNHGIPMKARFIHKRNGEVLQIAYDSLEKKNIYSVSRNYLNEILITAAEKNDVTFHFEHKLVNLDIDTNIMEFCVGEKKEKLKVNADLIIGADGAYSTVRREMLKQPMFNFSQTYIEHGYIELCIPPTDKKEFALPKNYLHIWPRNTFMMIALPNLDCSWTVSLFMPFKQFEALNSAETIIPFFEEHFSDAIPLIGKELLVRDYLSTKPSPLVSIKCKPFNKNSSCLLIGDAAHAMVPFYGQGMNAGFEDCCILEEIFSKNGDNLNKVLDEFSRTRCQDAAAICELAMYNYVEMRHLVTKRSFMWRKKLDDVLNKHFPTVWTPLYNSVTFSRMRYSECINNKKWQDKVVTFTATVFILLAALGIMKVWLWL